MIYPKAIFYLFKGDYRRWGKGLPEPYFRAKGLGVRVVGWGGVE